MRLIDCPTCRYTHLDPRPSKEEVRETTLAMFSKLPDFEAVKDEDAHWLRLQWDYALSQLAKATKGRRLLDVGSGSGHFLEYARNKGWNAQGLEPDPSMAAKTGAIQGFLEEHEEPYDAIHMTNVLEHLHDPREALKRCSRLASALYVSVPNDGNLLQRLLEPRYGKWWVSPLHVSYFSPKSLKRLCQNTGFQVLSHSTSFPMELFALLGSPYPKEPAKGKKWHRLRKHLDLLGLHRLYPLLAKTGLGRHVNMTLKRHD